jgi:hypothetical protein
MRKPNTHPVAFRVDFMFVDDNGGVHYVKAKGQQPATFWNGLPVQKQTCPILPAGAAFVLMLMSRQRRDDVLNAPLDWYPKWVEEKGRFTANVLCWWRIVVAVLGGLLDLADKIAGIMGKFRGAK